MSARIDPPWSGREPLPPAPPLCPFYGIAYREVPNYVDGYGCPVCKAISVRGHIPLFSVPFMPAVMPAEASTE